MKLTIWWSLHGSKIARELLQAFMEIGGSFGLGLRLGVCECNFGSKPYCMIHSLEKSSKDS